jgi:biotin operon repressor
VSIEIASRVLESLYDIWFKNYVVGYSSQDLIRETGYEENQINQAIQFLESNGLIISNNPRRYVVTTYGIDKREEMLSPALLAAKKQERRKILEVLAELYQHNVYDQIDSNVLAEKIQSTDRIYLLGTVVYLENIGLVQVDMYNGGFFYIRLTINGFQSLQDHTSDNSAFMSNAYRLLFNLENNMRKFIETKLIEFYKNDWWDKGINTSIRDSIDIKRKVETDAGWKVSETNSEMQFLDFTDIERVMRKNWKECFESYFHDQDRVYSRLIMLENIRNSIAHTRTLTIDSMNRLQQNYDDLMNLMNFNQSN